MGLVSVIDQDQHLFLWIFKNVKCKCQEKMKCVKKKKKLACNTIQDQILIVLLIGEVK